MTAAERQAKRRRLRLETIEECKQMIADALAALDQHGVNLGEGTDDIFDGHAAAREQLDLVLGRLNDLS